MNEASKAMRRRWLEAAAGAFEWHKIFRGKGLDVGCGPDKLPFDNCAAFDQEHGDANRLSQFIEPNSLSYLHASQSLEHMIDPVLALDDWIACVKPRGHLVITVPDFVLYEQLRWPSLFNCDHKSTWSMSVKGSPAPIHCYLPEWLTAFPVKVVRCKTVDTNYDYKLLGRTSVDQTYQESDGVEAFIEFVLRKGAIKKSKRSLKS